MKRIKSPTGCVHAVECGSEKEGYMTLCRHVNYNRSYGDGYFHKWELTSDQVTCRRCKLLIIRDQGAPFTEEVMYQWPANQICQGCLHATKFLNWAANEDVIMCDIKCKLNDGHACPEFKEVGEDEG